MEQHVELAFWQKFSSFCIEANLFFIFLLLLWETAFGQNYPKPIDGYYSQRGQDKFLNELIELTKYTISTQWKSDIDRLVNVLGL